MQRVDLNNASTHVEPLDLTVIILTLNEEIHIERCLSSAFQIACQVFVVDSFSTDRTITIAKSLGARVRQHEFKNHAMQLTWALENLPIETEWVMRLDADELISSGLADNIRAQLGAAALGVNGFQLSRYVRFGGALIRHGGFPHWVLRIWRKDTVEIEQRWMDEHVILKAGAAQRLKGYYIDDNRNTITWWTSKHNDYATREAIDLLNKKYKFIPAIPACGKLILHAQYKRWLKENFYIHLPIGLRASLFFFYRMFFCLGVLDGMRGFVFHFLQGFWYRFLVDVKVFEVERRMRSEGIDCAEAIHREFGIKF